MKFFPAVAGEFKGYALILYQSKTSSLQAKYVLEGRVVRDGHLLDCDWLKMQTGSGAGAGVEQQEGADPAAAIPSAAEISLHSKCLYVDQLPPDYRDMGEFRRLFSAVVSPPYCQVRPKCN